MNPTNEELKIMVVHRKSDLSLFFVGLILKNLKAHYIVMSGKKIFSDENINGLRNARIDYCEEIEKICRELEDGAYYKGGNRCKERTSDEKYILEIEEVDFFNRIDNKDLFEISYF